VTAEGPVAEELAVGDRGHGRLERVGGERDDDGAALAEAAVAPAAAGAAGAPLAGVGFVAAEPAVAEVEGRAACCGGTAGTAAAPPAPVPPAPPSLPALPAPPSPPTVRLPSKVLWLTVALALCSISRAPPAATPPSLPSVGVTTWTWLAVKEQCVMVMVGWPRS